MKKKLWIVTLAVSLLLGMAYGREQTEPILGEATQRGIYLGRLSVNPYLSDSLSNPHGAGNIFSSISPRNPYSRYDNPYSTYSATNPYATQAPRLYDNQGHYVGKLSINPYDSDSISNPSGRYGNPYSSESINNPYGLGNPYSMDSPFNPYGKGLKVYGQAP
jgi:hypothetical protein